MKKSSFVVLLLVGATVLGATVLREPIAWAAQAVDANIVAPLDANGNLKVHEQGTAAVNVTNSSIPVHQAGEPVTIQPLIENFQVPANKRLLIQYVNANHLDDSMSISIGPAGVVGVGYLFKGIPAPSPFGPTHIVSEAVTIHAQAGEFVKGSSEATRVVLSAYLFDE
jgi:hypothetical protein